MIGALFPLLRPALHGLDAETAFERLILQGEWLSMDRLARIRPR